MANRIIRDSARTSPTLNRLSAEAERFFWRLVLCADDVGRFDADPRVLLASCFPLMVAKIPVSSVRRWRKELSSVGAITLYEVAGREYGSFPNWSKHQRIYGSRPKFPEPPAATCGELPQAAANRRSYPKTISDIQTKTKAKTRIEKGESEGEEIVVSSNGAEEMRREEAQARLRKSNEEFLEQAAP